MHSNIYQLVNHSKQLLKVNERIIHENEVVVDDILDISKSIEEDMIFAIKQSLQGWNFSDLVKQIFNTNITQLFQKIMADSL